MDAQWAQGYRWVKGRYDSSKKKPNSVVKRKLISYFCGYKMRIVEPYKNYFWDFYKEQTDSVREKIDYALQVVMTVQHIPQKFFKHLEDGIYEIRVKVGSDIYRIFCFFDDNKLVILLNAFQKKSQKTPKNEIGRAKRLRQEYYENKESKNDQ